jgi:hypothetical protein
MQLSDEGHQRHRSGRPQPPAGVSDFFVDHFGWEEALLIDENTLSRGAYDLGW